MLSLTIKMVVSSAKRTIELKERTGKVIDEGRKYELDQGARSSQTAVLTARWISMLVTSQVSEMAVMWECLADARDVRSSECR